MLASRVEDCYDQSMAEVPHEKPDWTARAMCRGSKTAEVLFADTGAEEKAEAYARYCAFCLVRTECTNYGKAGKQSGRMYGDHNRPKSVAKAPQATKEQAMEQRRVIVETEILHRPLTSDELQAAGYDQAQPEIITTVEVLAEPQLTKRQQEITELKAQHPVSNADADDWRAESACASSGLPVDDFFLARAHRATQQAIALCVECPFQTECSAWADSLGARYGVWAGQVRTPQSMSS